MPFYTCPRRNLNILFIHIPKCGGGSVEKFLKLNGFLQHLKSIDASFNSVLKCSPQHFHGEILMVLFKEQLLDYSFAIVRHPVARLVSEYKWRICHPLAALGFNEWYRVVREEYKTDNYIYDNHLRPQVEFLIPSLKLFRFEDGLENALMHLSADLNLKLEFSFLENQKQGLRLSQIQDRADLCRLYAQASPNSDVLKLIEQDYAQDFELYRQIHSN